jgi:hypothetical protein
MAPGFPVFKVYGKIHLSVKGNLIKNAQEEVVLSVTGGSLPKWQRINEDHIVFINEFNTLSRRAIQRPPKQGLRAGRSHFGEGGV